MAYVKDRWTVKVDLPDGTSKRVRTDRYGKGKRWLAVWKDPNGRERSAAFDRKVDAEKKASSMEVDVDRGDYYDPRAGKRSGWIATPDCSMCASTPARTTSPPRSTGSPVGKPSRSRRSCSVSSIMSAGQSRVVAHHQLWSILRVSGCLIEVCLTAL